MLTLQLNNYINIYNAVLSFRIMPADMEKILKTKDLIISTIKLKGPTLPIHVARTINLNTIFASAFLSELYCEKKILMSQMKVGSSSLYYLPGQESQLENFIEYLNHKEREAFLLLKKEKILDDEKTLPAIRVALREIKDFAIPLKVKIDDKTILFWKYYLVSDPEASNLIEFYFLPKNEKSIKKEILQDLARKEQILEKEIKHEQKFEEIIKKDINFIPAAALDQINEKQDDKSKKIKGKKSTQDFKFSKKIKEYLSSKDIEILSIFEEKSKDFLAKVRLDTPLGKQEFYLVAKDKKKITEDDIAIALHKAQLEKMPALFLATGEIDKKATDHAKLWRNLVRIEKLKF